MFAEDLTQFFDASELAETCVVGGVDVVCVFTQEGDVAEDVEGHVPILVAPITSLPPAVGDGTTVEAPKGSGTTYLVRQCLPDHTGRLWRMLLEEV